MPSLSRRSAKLRSSAIRKLDALVAQRPQTRFYRVNIGQPDVPTPKPMLDAIAAFNPAVLAYGPASGIGACREAAAAYHARWAPELQPEHVAVTTGGSEALIFAIALACDTDDEILVPEPYYTNYHGFATTAGARLRPLRTHLERGFALPTREELEAALTPHTRAILLANPGNPTGAIYDREQMASLVDFAVEHDLFILSDEVYRRIWFDQPPPSILEFPEARQLAVCIDSLSKTWSACGLRLGFLISFNEELMAAVERLGQSRLGPQPLAQEAALAALSMPESHYEETRLIYRDRIDALMEALEPIEGVEVHRPQGAFYLMARLPVEDTEDFARFMAAEFEDEGESVVVAPGGGFFSNPHDGRHLIRLAAVLEPAKLRRAGELIGLGLQAYKAR